MGFREGRSPRGLVGSPLVRADVRTWVSPGAKGASKEWGEVDDEAGEGSIERAERRIPPVASVPSRRPPFPPHPPSPTSFAFQANRVPRSLSCLRDSARRCVAVEILREKVVVHRWCYSFSPGAQGCGFVVNSHGENQTVRRVGGRRERSPGPGGVRHASQRRHRAPDSWLQSCIGQEHALQPRRSALAPRAQPPVELLAGDKGEATGHS